MITLLQIDGTPIDLSISERFVAHYNSPNSFAKHIIEKEINEGYWYDSVLSDLPKDAVVIDAGANVGLFTLYLLPKIGRVYCIEPTTAHIEVASGLLSKFSKNYTLHGFALAARYGFQKFAVAENNTTENKLAAEGVTVPTKTLRHFLSLQNIQHVDLLKLDIEGAEQQVICEDVTVGEALQKCANVYIETHPAPYGNTDEAAIIAKMQGYGFTHKPAARGMAHYFTK